METLTETKTVIRISNDYHSQLSYDIWREDIAMIVNEYADVRCDVANDRLINPIEESQNYVPSVDQDCQIKVTAKGYSQGDWQEYTIHYFAKDKKYVEQLAELLERSFTHQNDYQVERFERTEINGKTFDAAPHDYTTISVNWEEFPEEEEIKKAYDEQYGEDYDEIIFNLD